MVKASHCVGFTLPATQCNNGIEILQKPSGTMGERETATTQWHHGREWNFCRNPVAPRERVKLLQQHSATTGESETPATTQCHHGREWNSCNNTVPPWERVKLLQQHSATMGERETSTAIQWYSEDWYQWESVKLMQQPLPVYQQRENIRENDRDQEGCVGSQRLARAVSKVKDQHGLCQKSKTSKGCIRSQRLARAVFEVKDQQGLCQKSKASKGCVRSQRPAWAMSEVKDQHGLCRKSTASKCCVWSQKSAPLRGGQGSICPQWLQWQLWVSILEGAHGTELSVKSLHWSRCQVVLHQQSRAKKSSGGCGGGRGLDCMNSRGPAPLRGSRALQQQSKASTAEGTRGLHQQSSKSAPEILSLLRFLSNLLPGPCRDADLWLLVQPPGPPSWLQHCQHCQLLPLCPLFSGVYSCSIFYIFKINSELIINVQFKRECIQKSTLSKCEHSQWVN